LSKKGRGEIIEIDVYDQRYPLRLSAEAERANIMKLAEEVDLRMREIAHLTARHLERSHKIFEHTPIGLKRAILEYRRLHNEARRQYDSVSLSAFTLVLIYVRAEGMGEDCRPAMDAIDAFIGEWGHALSDNTEPKIKPWE